jgi:hypothetical protein
MSGQMRGAWNTASKLLTLTLVITVALALRLAYLDAEPFWVDEAESSINALTILQHGYPTDSYLGLPIYENTFVQSWLGNPEYAFRDVSYSETHLAIYHGWLPLYSIAASLAASGIQPDRPGPPYTVKHDPAARKKETTAARIPAVLFGVLFVFAAFLAGKVLYGEHAAWAGLFLSSVHPWAIHISRQARYYSAEVLLTTVCCALAWLMVRRGQWKDFIGGGLAFALLFHTHLQSFFAGGLVVVLTAPVIVHLHKRAVEKLAIFGAIVVLAAAPWLWATHFLGQQGRIPRAWPLLRLPDDLFRYPPFTFSTMAVGVALAVAACWLLSRPATVISDQQATAIRKAVPVLAFLMLWIMCGYTSFIATIPAASFAPERMNLSYWGPALLVASIVSGAIAQMISSGERSTGLAPAVALVLYLVAGHSLELPRPSPGKEWRRKSEVIGALAATQFDSATKFYASPNSHLIWTVYTGLPVQSIAPIRREYLNGYRGDVVYIDSFSDWNEVVTATRVREAARRNGRTLSQESAEQWSELLRTRDYRESMLKDAGESEVKLEAVPVFGRSLLQLSRERDHEMFATHGLELISRGLPLDVRSWRDWRAAFYLRFAPDQGFRPDALANYGERLRGSDAMILENSGVAIYKSKWHPPERGGSIKFTFVRAEQFAPSPAAHWRSDFRSFRSIPGGFN